MWGERREGMTKKKTKKKKTEENHNDKESQRKEGAQRVCTRNTKRD
jgi:hypothetical protein